MDGSKTVQTLIDDGITDQFFLQELNIDGTLEIEWTNTYAVAVVIQGHGSVQPEGSSSSSQYMSLKAGDQLFISADTGPVTWSGKLQAIISCPGKTRFSVKSMP